MFGLELSTPSIITLGLIAITWYFIRRKNANKILSYDKIDIRGKTVIVTGANCGIGKETAKQFAKLGARVILACRDVAKANAAAAEIHTFVNDANLIVKELDLADLTSVKNFCEGIISQERSVDILINNAGVFGIPQKILEDGTELQFVVNHLGHHLLTRLLLPLIQRSDIKRIVIVSSITYVFGTIDFNDVGNLIPSGGIKQYMNTKLMNCMFATELHRRFSSVGVSAFALHPGLINTNMDRGMPWRGVGYVLKPLVYVAKQFMPSVYDGCKTTMYCAMANGIEGLSGKYFRDSKLYPWDLKKMDTGVARKLWDYCDAKVDKFL